ncbi:MAG: hypothetical protein KF729_23365 [Sandaracinaceae bacterium]|nr:hypothetical protein [Sandaracinaceae bacterium]
MRAPRWLLPALFTLPLFAAGCDCDGTLGNACSTDRDCDPGSICEDGRCRRVPPGTDAGPRDAGSSMDSGDTPGVDAGPPVCHPLCGDCEPGCDSTPIPGPGGWMPTEETSEGVIVDEGGALTLGRNEAQAFAVWVANMDEGTVSKLDSRTGREVGRYPTIGAMSPAGVRPWNEACNWSNLGNCPSRTAVDQNFDAYVANRAFGNQGTVTKYANREEDCVDRNANGVIDTSRDLNGNGVIDMGTPEFVGPDDECILYTVATGGGNGVPRALAIGLAPPDAFVGDFWVGLFNERQACRYRPHDGSLIACMPIDNFQPYGMAADSSDRVWVVDRSGSGRRDVLGFISSTLMTFTPVAGMPAASSCAVPYGVTVDGNGDVFLANQCDPSIWRYRHADGSWTAVDAVPFNGSTRGVAADETNLWVALSHQNDGFTGGSSNRIRQYSLADLSFVAEHTMPSGRQPIGIGVSFDGSVWAICLESNSAARLEPGAGTWTEHPVGLNPYTYSDFIGFGLNVFAEPRGRHRFVVEGCESGTQTWRGVSYRAEIPASTAVEVWARTADTRAGLEAQAWIGPFPGNPADFRLPPGPVPDGRYLQVELRLSTTDRTARPRVFSVDVAGVCEPILD